jgi:hypothetical protein
MHDGTTDFGIGGAITVDGPLLKTGSGTAMFNVLPAKQSRQDGILIQSRDTRSF